MHLLSLGARGENEGGAKRNMPRSWSIAAAALLMGSGALLW